MTCKSTSASIPLRHQALSPSSFGTLAIEVTDTLHSEEVPGRIPRARMSAIRGIDIHRASFSTCRTRGLVQGQWRLRTGRNIIFPPPTQYWKKALHYVFGGFKFLMWIALIVTIARKLRLVASIHLHPSLYPAFI